MKTDQTAKKQALDCIKQLQSHYKIIRGDMRIRLAFKQASEETILTEIKKMGIEKCLSSEVKNEMCTYVYDIEPNKYR